MKRSNNKTAKAMVMKTEFRSQTVQDKTKYNRSRAMPESEDIYTYVALESFGMSAWYFNRDLIEIRDVQSSVEEPIATLTLKDFEMIIEASKKEPV